MLCLFFFHLYPLWGKRPFLIQVLVLGTEVLCFYFLYFPHFLEYSAFLFTPSLPKAHQGHSWPLAIIYVFLCFHPVDETYSVPCCCSTILKLLSKYFNVIFANIKYGENISTFSPFIHPMVNFSISPIICLIIMISFKGTRKDLTSLPIWIKRHKRHNDNIHLNFMARENPHTPYSRIHKETSSLHGMGNLSWFPSQPEGFLNDWNKRRITFL